MFLCFFCGVHRFSNNVCFCFLCRLRCHCQLCFRILCCLFFLFGAHVCGSFVVREGEERERERELAILFLDLMIVVS